MDDYIVELLKIVAAAGGAWYAVRVELRYLREQLADTRDELKIERERINRIERERAAIR